MTNTLAIILASALTTFIIRATPFVFLSKKELPDTLMYLGKVLPFALMPLLVVFAFRNISMLSYPYGLPELIAAALVIILHAKFKKMFVSIGVGTIVYMILVQFIFI